MATEIGGTAPFQMGAAAPLPLAGGPGAAAAAAYRRAQAARQAGRMKEAWELCQQAIRADANHGEAVALAGLLAWQRGDYKQSLPLLQKAMKLRPKDATAISNYGAALQSLGKLEEAISMHRKAVRAEPGYVKGHTNLASGLLQAGRFEEAAKSFRRALDLDGRPSPRHSRGWVSRCRSWVIWKTRWRSSPCRRRSDARPRHPALQPCCRGTGEGRWPGRPGGVRCRP